MHSTNDLRSTFDTAVLDGEIITADALAALQRSTDVIPAPVADELDLPAGSSYADGVIAHRGARR